MTAQLTERQQKCLEAIIEYLAQHGYAPSYRDLAAALGLTSHSVVTYYLEQLRDKGYVTWEEHKSRTLHVLKEAP